MLLMGWLMPLISQSAKSGAQPTLMAALDPRVEGGDYFGPLKRNEMVGPAGKVDSKPQSKNLEVAANLWKVSEQLTGGKFFTGK